jgi:2-dehydro-3-deoxyphosphogluconate aldolase/(4S)-4-hydroxy-2-oxoglutarate aldolase
MSINNLLAESPVVPLVQADDPAVAVSTSRALAAGGLKVAEIVFRSDRALECLRAVADEVPETIAGAGTVLSARKFIVSPGLDEGVVAVAQEHGVPVYPGTMTPGEVQRAFNLGLDVVKFFPASIAGGVPALVHADRRHKRWQPCRFSRSAIGSRVRRKLAYARGCDCRRGL